MKKQTLNEIKYKYSNEILELKNKIIKSFKEREKAIKAFRNKCPHKKTTQNLGTPYDSWTNTCDECGKEL
jgi:hypothetical protein